MTKTKLFVIGYILFLLVGISFMLAMKFTVGNLEKELVKINASIQQDMQSIHILNAEWSYLSSPHRLRMLTEKYIFLKPVKAEQIINYSELPFDNNVSDSSRRSKARRSLADKAWKNRGMKKLVNVQR